MNILGIIPARYDSTRFPGKPLAPLAGKPLLQHVVERCQKAERLSQVIVATDDTRIADVARRFARVEMTQASHPSGTDRAAEVLQRYPDEAAVNIQGDEPLIDPSVINQVAAALAHAPMTTAATPIQEADDYHSPNVVKVVVNQSGRALYFSRQMVPYLRDAPGGSQGEPLTAFPFLKHLGIYGYRRETLLWLVRQPVSRLEDAEKLEQLRALDYGIEIAVVKVDYSGFGVDSPDDLVRAEEKIRG